MIVRAGKVIKRSAQQLVLAASIGGFGTGLLVMIAVSAGTFACILALPAHSLHEAQELRAVDRTRSCAESGDLR